MEIPEAPCATEYPARQENALSPLLLCIPFNPLNALLDKSAYGYRFKGGLIIDITVPRDENIQDKELKKIDKYQSLKIELEEPWKV